MMTIKVYYDPINNELISEGELNEYLNSILGKTEVQNQIVSKVINNLHIPNIIAGILVNDSVAINTIYECYKNGIRAYKQDLIGSLLIKEITV